MKKQASKKKLVEHTVARLEESQATTLAAIERISTHFDIDNRQKPPIDEMNSAVIRYLDTAANYALNRARHILPKVADVKAHPLPAFQDLTVAPVSKRTLKDTADEITDYLNDELRYLAPGMMRGLEDFLTWYQGEFLEALRRLTEKKIAVCDTLGKTDAKRKLIEAFSALPSFTSPEAFEDYNKRILAGDDPDPTEEMVYAWRKHQPAPFPDPNKFAELFRDALKKDAEATEEINGVTETAVPTDKTQDVLGEIANIKAQGERIESKMNETQTAAVLALKADRETARSVKTIGPRIAKAVEAGMEKTTRSVGGVRVQLGHLKGAIEQKDGDLKDLRQAQLDTLAAIGNLQVGNSADGNEEHIPSSRDYQVTTAQLSEMLTAKNCGRSTRQIQLWEKYLKTNGQEGTPPPDDYNLYTRLTLQTATAWVDGFAVHELRKLKTKVAFDDRFHQRPK